MQKVGKCATFHPIFSQHNSTIISLTDFCVQFSCFISWLFFVCREELPGEWKDNLDDFQQLLVLRCLRPDKLTNVMQDYVARHLGQRFIEPQV